MGKPITKKTRLKVGQLVAWGTAKRWAVEGRVVYEITKINKDKKRDLLFGLNKFTDHKEHKQEFGVDRYSWYNKNDLIKLGAKIISPLQLIVRYNCVQRTLEDLQTRLQQAAGELEIYT